MLQDNQILQNRYRIIHVLGRGANGSFYLAQDQTLSRRNVVKEMTITPAASNNMAQLGRQLQQDAEVLRRLRHPNLPAVTDYITSGDGYYLVTEYIDGQNLQELVPPGGFSEEMALYYTDQLLDTLQYLHANGVVHGNIKPANIILKPDAMEAGRFGRVVLVGIGLAHALHSGSEPDALAYAPPEQAGGQMDQRGDLYALGATLYRILVGRAPASAAERLANGAPIEPRKLSPGIATQTEQVILRAMALNPSERYADASAMRAALAERLATPLPAQPAMSDASADGYLRSMPTLSQRSASPMSRVVLLICGAVLAVIVILVVALLILK